jgi:tetratricopeptide (TPR) repeat protein
MELSPMKFFLALILALPGAAFAAGGSDGGTSTNPPTTSETTANCKGVKVWDKKTKTCVNPQGTSLDDGTLYDAVRELAYAGRYQDAQGVLRVMSDQKDDRVLTYWGFTHRKMGNGDLARIYYQDAIRQNPDNILARSYMGQGFIEDGDTGSAIAQWYEIKARGGEGTWAEASLRTAIRTGLTHSY